MHWVHVNPPRAEKKIGPNLQGKVVSAPQAESAPRGRERVHFLGNWEIWTVGEVI